MLSIQLSTTQNLSQQKPIATRQIKDTARLEAGINEVWRRQQMEKESLIQDLSGSRMTKYLPKLLTNLENDIVNILVQLQSKLLDEDPLILSLHKELEKYPNLENTELSLLVIESLINGKGAERAKINKVWLEVFKKVESRWLYEVGCTAERAFIHLIKRGDFVSALELLEAVGDSLGADFCKKLASVITMNGGYEALLDHLKGRDPGTLAEVFWRELSFCHFLRNEKSEESDEILKAVLESCDKGEILDPAIWTRLFEKIADSKFIELKLEAWEVWLKQSLRRDESFGRVWVQAVRLLKEGEIKDAVGFYLSDLFVEVMDSFLKGEKKAICDALKFYDHVYHCARKSSEDHSCLIVAHKDNMQKYPALKAQRITATLAKLNENKLALSPSHLKEVLDDLENEVIGGREIWCKVLEKVVLCKFADLKQRTWGLWSRQYTTLKSEKSYGNIWLEAIKLLEAPEKVEFFCGQLFSAVLQSFITNKSGEPMAIYKILVNASKNSTANLPRIVRAHQKYVEEYPSLKNHDLFLTVTQLANDCLKSDRTEMAFQLIQRYVYDSHADLAVLKGSFQWLLDRLQLGAPRKTAIPSMLELAESLLELGDKNPSATNYYTMAERLNKINISGFQDLAVRYAFKGLHSVVQEDLSKKVNQKQLDAYFDLMMVILPNTSERGFFSLLDREAIQDFQNRYNPKFEDKWAIFWKEMAFRSLKIRPEEGLGLLFACDFWKFVKNTGIAQELFKKMITTSSAILPSKDTVGIENYADVYRNLCTKLALAFQEKITYKMGDDGRIPVNRDVDQFLRYLCLESELKEPHSYLMLSIACDIVKDSERLKDFVETGIAQVVAKTCLKRIDRIKESAVMEKPDFQPFLLSVKELLNAKELQGYYGDLLENAKHLNKLMAIHAPALFKIFLDAKQKQKSDLSKEFVGEFKKFNIHAYSLFQASDLAVQKVIWKFAMKFACESDELVSEEIWVKNLNKWIDLLDEMLAAKVKDQTGQPRVSLSHLNDVIEVCDLVAPFLSDLASDYYNSDIRDQIISALVYMSDLQINYRKSTPEKKREVLLRLVQVAIVEDVTNVNRDRIMQFAMDSKRKEPLREMAMKKVPQMVKIEGEDLSPFAYNSSIKRKGVADLFHYLLTESAENDSFNALLLASNLLKIGRFENFQNVDHCEDMMQIFSDVMIGTDDYDQKEILEYDIFSNIFYALTHKPRRIDGVLVEDEMEWDEINSLDELIGTDNAECRKKTIKTLNQIIGFFFTTCGDEGEYLSLSTEAEETLSCFEKFLNDCREKQFLDHGDLKLWDSKFILLRGQVKK